MINQLSKSIFNNRIRVYTNIMNVIECFTNITRDNAVCKHTTCKSNAHRNIALPRNNVCAHKEADLQFFDIKEIQTYLLLCENELSQEQVNALLSAIFILSGCCTCKFAWDTTVFFGELLTQVSQNKFKLLCDNWVIQLFLSEMPGLWGRESVIRNALSKLRCNDNTIRIDELTELIKPFYDYSMDTPWVLLET